MSVWKSKMVVVWISLAVAGLTSPAWAEEKFEKAPPES